MTQYENVWGKRTLAVCLLTAALLAPPAVEGQESSPEGTKGPAAQARDVKPWSVRMSKAAPHTFSVKAKEARLAEVAGELSRLLKVPVTLSPLLEKQRVSLDFSGMNLEGALRLLAPQAYIDYVAGGPDLQPQPLAIYLQGHNERPPSLTATVKGTSEAILIEGDTEEGIGDEEGRKKKETESPLRVTFTQRQLSVRARKQPLTVVLFKIASEIGVPFELRWESPELVDVEFDNYSIEQAVRTLSPAVRLYYRMNLQSFDVQPLRLALVAPASGKS